VRASPEEGWNLPSGSNRLHSVDGEVPPDCGGCWSPKSHATANGLARELRRSFDLRVERGSGSEGQGTNSRGAKSQESIGRDGGVTRRDVNGLDCGRKASKSVKLAEHGGSVTFDPGRLGSGSSGSWKGDP